MTILVALLLSSIVYPWIAPQPWEPAHPIVEPLRVELVGADHVELTTLDNRVSINVYGATGCTSVHLLDSSGQEYRASVRATCGRTTFIPFASQGGS